MSEYQYYEFQALDRPLTQPEMRRLRAVSTRATITPTRFVNFYTWGDFKGNPSAWIQKYFDAFLYLANWGTHELMLRLPRSVLDPETAERYCRGESASARASGDFTILEFHSDSDAGDGWEDDGSGWLSSLVPLRGDLAGGDHRALYLGWLLCAQQRELADDETEPPVPPGLARLTAPLKAFADFLRIDADLIEVAAEGRSRDDDRPTRAELERWIAALPGSEKDRLLARIATDDGAHLRTELLRRFRQTGRAQTAQPDESRTVAGLLAAAERRGEARRRKAADRAARENTRREQEAAAARARYLDELAGREAEEWRRVDALVATRRPAAYEEAAQLLSDLRELALRDGRAAEVEARIRALREQHARKPNFLHRLRQATPSASPR